MSSTSKVRAIVIGANGLVGRRVGKMLSGKRIPWKGTYHKRHEEGLARLDITDPAEIEGLFEKYSPQVVFQCANLAGGVDFCESNPTLAAEFHLSVTKDIAYHCGKIGAALLLISTDYVFDGTKGPYREDDEPDPLNVYGTLKLEAERWLAAHLKSHLIVRTTNIYGWDPATVTPNYIMGLYRSLKAGTPFNAPSFLWGNPTYADDLAAAMVELYEKKAGGVYHVVGPTLIDRFEWARHACKILGLDASLLKEVKAPLPTMVPRPLKSWLNTDKFMRSFKTVLHDADEGLELMKREMGDKD